MQFPALAHLLYNSNQSQSFTMYLLHLIVSCKLPNLYREVKRNDKSMSNLAQLLDSSAQNTAKMRCHELQYSKDIQYVKMHGHPDCNTKSTILVEAGERLREIPVEEKGEVDLTKISLMENCTSNIPTSASPKCPRLTTLMLNDIENLPTSIDDLVNLTALCLVGCSRLQNVPSLENLKSLRRLNLRWAGIKVSTKRHENVVGSEISQPNRNKNRNDTRWHFTKTIMSLISWNSGIRERQINSERRRGSEVGKALNFSRDIV
ncbi:hypothetical protein FEM48_Zijuj07G0166800 [Ziziphus jujuba var. spinosa]|uniref:Uncharacterized protein n=1 Tax=Ziziphus jujuba var. spinosa TaxID=714518 RepID=A0A978V5S1_ZIZJJ|nr:hypothetical protein FEM48_Zijuj07G0166800 [Ziziphus jujuba var. spinosa]